MMQVCRNELFLLKTKGKERHLVLASSIPKDSGVQIADLHWSPSEDRLLYVNGRNLVLFGVSDQTDDVTVLSSLDCSSFSGEALVACLPLWDQEVVLVGDYGGNVYRVELVYEETS